ncbi:MAG: DUF1566 domain-containing protein [Cytophagaceae bacterium]|jgi:hypothetical protein|nr:DUF1566 domain-containing protein [Cytophagaceae bacterium]
MFKYFLLSALILFQWKWAQAQDTMIVHLKNGSIEKFIASEVDSIRFRKAYVVGDVGPAGGYIIYDKGLYTNGWRYLEAAPADIIGNYSWGCSGSSFPSATLSAIGDGFMNTNVIVGSCSDNGAAKACFDYVFGGYSDWYLPNSNEILLFYPTVDIRTKLNISLASDFWSSEESNTVNAKVGTSIGPLINLKSDTNPVRPIRRF